MIGVVIYSLDGLLDYDLYGDDLVLAAAFWPLSIWFLFGGVLRSKLKDMKRTKNIREEQARYRIKQEIAKQDEAERELRQIEKEIEEDLKRRNAG